MHSQVNSNIMSVAINPKSYTDIVMHSQGVFSIVS